MKLFFLEIDVNIPYHFNIANDEIAIILQQFPPQTPFLAQHLQPIPVYIFKCLPEPAKLVNLLCMLV